MSSEYSVSIKNAKQYTLEFVRNKNISETDFLNILSLIECNEGKRIDSLSFRWECGSASQFFKKLFLSIDFDKIENEPLIVRKNEEYLFSLLPNDADLLLSVLYYFLLEPEKQKEFLWSCITGLVSKYRNILEEKSQPRYQSLLKSYHLLTPQRKQIAVSFVKFLLSEQRQR